ncbi:unnamed protein product [Pedinophyceae sp. YPF-701]|nr:unnamed protein product [Pedinophyceae sp. YPF-701]
MLANLKKLQLVSKVAKELDNHLGVADKDLAEFVIEKAQAAKDATDFASKLKEEGGELDAGLCETIFGMVGRSLGGPAAGAPAAGTGLKPRPGVKYGALAIPDTVDRAHEFTEELKARMKGDAAPATATAGDGNGAALPPPPPRPDGHDGERYRREDRGGRGDREAERDRRRGERERRRDDDDDRNGDRRRDDRDRGRDRRRRSRSRSPRRGDGRRGRGGSPDVRGRTSGGQKYPGPPPRGPTKDAPDVGAVYRGSVTRVLDMGAFIELSQGLTRPMEGLVHRKDISAQSVVASAKDALRRGQDVFARVVKCEPGASGRLRIALDMKHVDQKTGQDLAPAAGGAGKGAAAGANGRAPGGGARLHNPEGPSGAPAPAARGLSGVTLKEEPAGSGARGRRAGKKFTEQELFEVKQLVASGVLTAEERPDYDEEHGLLFGDNQGEDEEFEIDLNDAEPAFLKGCTARTGVELSPIRITKNPDGTMQRAAMTASALAKERRELKEQQQRALADAIPKDLSKPWEDPMADQGERFFAAELRGVGLQHEERGAWKTANDTKVVTYGRQDTRSIKEQRESLPIFKLKQQLIQAVNDNQVLVVIGETGSGKTTQMTQYLAEAGYTAYGRIGCTQPRRVAAMSIAKRVAEEFGCRLGEEVGFAVRFEDCTSSSTVIKYMTDGMLLRECLMDDVLSNYSVIILDEAHERTINTDVLFGLLKGVLTRRKDLKLIATSATLDAEKFSTYFWDCPIFTIPGRTYPVEVLYSAAPESDYVSAALKTVMEIHLTQPPGDILLFLTGQEEIDTACETLYEQVKALGASVPELIVLPVYSALPSEMQTRIFEAPPPGKRKCVVATNIAEASLTIDGIYFVVDPGFSKVKVYNAKLGMDSLVTSPISQASARQRAGRAGRTGPGKCYRLYTETAFKHEMLPTSVPEIQRTNMAMTVLTLKAMGINDLLNFDFMDPPPAQTLISALEQLYNLGALDDEGLLTRLGRRMAEFPLEPPLSKMLIASVDLNCSDEVMTIISMLQEDNIFHRPRDKQQQADGKKAKFQQPEGDHLTLLTVYESWKNSNFSSQWCYENFIQARSMKRAQDVRKQLLAIMDRYKLDVVSARGDFTRIQKAITSGYFFHAARKDPQEGYRTVVEQQTVYVHPSSAIFGRQPDWCIYHKLVLTTKEYMHGVMAIDPRWLVELAPRFFRGASETDGKMSRRKQRERIEPLYDKWSADPNAWRLSKRFG